MEQFNEIFSTKVTGSNVYFEILFAKFQIYGRICSMNCYIQQATRI